MHKSIRVGVVLSLILPAIGVGCFETQIVEDDDGDSDSGSGSGGRDSGGVNVEACQSCAEKACPSETSSCEDEEGCSDYVRCLFACEATDVTCRAACNTAAGSGAAPSVAAVTAATLLSACAYVECMQDCAATPGGSGDAGAGGSDGTPGGGSGSAGRPPGGNAGSAGAGFGGSGGSTGGSTGFAGSGGVPVTSGVNWLTLDGSRASAEASPNGELGIDGVFYAYSDGCSQITWDAATRCASGYVCLPNPPTYSNWGVAVNFDFRNTGETGTPPNTKYTWNPTSVGARGIAWQMRGIGLSLVQLWVLNMAPVWGGQCGSDTCDIEGPPDGTPAPSASGQLLFSNMVKDDWGGSGVYYVFDPAAVHAVQFKIPAVIAGGSSFDFCIDRFGVVR